MCGVIPVVFVFSLMFKYCVTNYFYFSHSIHKTKALRTSTLLCSFLAIKRKVEVDLTRTVQQIYEEERTKQSAESDTVMSDFVEVKFINSILKRSMLNFCLTLTFLIPKTMKMMIQVMRLMKMISMMSLFLMNQSMK